MSAIIVKTIMFLFLLVELGPLSIDGQATPYIHNHLEGNLDLTVHCKSKDDDLGPHVLHPNQSYHFTFSPRIFFGATLFFCTFRWKGSCHWFNIYDQYRDQDVCENICHWIIKKAGPCQNTGSNHTCYPWKPDKCV
ncbi:hypothetical protein HN51_067035 [Arachis hypogaea]|nr:uncharacterized protein DS421_14g472610 [Arachis hypogaea]